MPQSRSGDSSLRVVPKEPADKPSVDAAQTPSRSRVVPAGYQPAVDRSPPYAQTGYPEQ